MSLPYRKILVPLDGSAIAAQAIPHAEELAHQSGAELILLRVVPDTSQQVGLTLEMLMEYVEKHHQRELVEQAAQSLERLTESLQHRHIKAQTVVDVGDAAAKILDYAIHHTPDLIVMSTHGRTGLARWAYGSVTAKVLQTAPCPVLLVRSQLD